MGRLLNWMARNRSRLVAVALWVVAIGAWNVWSSQRNLTPLAAVQALIEVLRGTFWGPAIYIVIYAVRPLLFFPATFLTIAGGYLFGPYWGLFYTIVAGNVSAAVAYLAGRLLGRGLIQDLGPLAPYADRMRARSFETVLILRLLFAPYDLIGYLAGFLTVSFRGFLVGTALGSLPGSLAVVSFGAAIQGDFTGELPRLDPANLILGAVMLIVSLLLSRWVRAREARATAARLRAESTVTAGPALTPDA
ncbi:MAG TPA: VTT domain-containing protein [Anaerolineales bacterium]|nr:VTT domain-containing protein [Anaerolineales bacterium]